MQNKIVAALLLASGISASPLTKRTLSCDSNQALNGTVYTSSTGSVYTILCGTDYAGGDLSSTSTNSFDDCIAACDATSGCIDVSYVSDTATCYMKNQLEAPVLASNVWTALKATSGVSVSSPSLAIASTTTSQAATSSVSSVAATSTQATLCDSNNTGNGTIYNAANGSSFQVFCTTDFFGGDMTNSQTSSFSACIDLCDETDGCIDVSYTGSTCYLKSTLTGAQSNVNVAAARKPAATITTPSIISSVVASTTTTPFSAVASLFSSASSAAASSSAAALTSTSLKASSTAARPTSSSAAPSTTSKASSSVTISTSSTKASTTLATSTVKASSTATSSKTSSAPASTATNKAALQHYCTSTITGAFIVCPAGVVAGTALNIVGNTADVALCIATLGLLCH